MSPDTVTLREHLTALMDERQLRTDAQFEELRTEVKATRAEVEGTRADVIALKAAREAASRMRASDWTKITGVAATLGAIAAFAIH